MDASSSIDPQIFEELQTKIDEDTQVKDEIRAVTQTLERQSRMTTSALSKAHSTPAKDRELSLRSSRRMPLTPKQSLPSSRRHPSLLRMSL